MDIREGGQKEVWIEIRRGEKEEENEKGRTEGGREGGARMWK